LKSREEILEQLKVVLKDLVPAAQRQRAEAILLFH
jgi:hypothetical protein